MSKNYDNWERLVRAVLKRELYRQLAREDSLSSSFSSDYSLSFRSVAPFRLIGTSFSHQDIARATRYFSNENLIKSGHSGDLFKGELPSLVFPVLVKRIDVIEKGSWESLSLELEFFSKINNHSHNSRFIPLLGYSLEDDDGDPYVKFLVYPYLPMRDLSYSLFKKDYDPDRDDLPSLDWIRRWKIARGVAEGLAYMHHECSPPLAHGDIQASSILLDHNFDVRLGSLNCVRPQERSGKDNLGMPNATGAYDVYCFGKVLLELVTGKLGISSSTDKTTKKWLEATLPYINIHDKELVLNILDPSLIIDEDLLEEVWAMAIVAGSCLSPKPSQRPLMKYILKAMENPLKVVREEHQPGQA